MNPRIYVLTLVTFAFGSGAFIFAGLYVWYSIWMDKRGGDNINHSAHLWGGLYGMMFTLLQQPELAGQPCTLVQAGPGGGSQRCRRGARRGGAAGGDKQTQPQRQGQQLQAAQSVVHRSLLGGGWDQGRFLAVPR